MDAVGLSILFPRVEVYIIHGSPVDMLERPPLDGETTEIEYVAIIVNRGRKMGWALFITIFLLCICKVPAWRIIFKCLSNTGAMKHYVFSETMHNWLLRLVDECFIIPEYFPHIGRLNQLLVLSQQLEEDIKHLGSHKYIAHQLSAIYVSLFQCIHFGLLYV